MSMNGQERVERQMATGVRERVVFIDAVRTKYGFSNVTSLTPKVETRLRSGEQPQINLLIRYVHRGVSIITSVGRDYPESHAIDVTLKLDEDVEEITEQEETSRARKLAVIQEYIGRYCNTLGDEENEKEEIIGIDIIERCMALLDEHWESSSDIHINSLGEIQPSIFQFGNLNDALNNLASTITTDPDSEGAVSNDDEEREEAEEVDEEGKVAAPTVQYKCKKCRCVLFSSSDVLDHEEARPSPSGCTSVFLDEEIILEGGDGDATAGGGDKATGVLKLDDTGGGGDSGTSGKLVCRKCMYRFGSWNWIGLSCSCKAWVCPAFQVTLSKVDIA